MDAIRLRQIDEALSYDRNINAMVFDIEKKRAARYPETEVIPDSQTDEDMEATSTEQVNALRVILDNKYANLLGMIRPGVKIDSDQFTYASRETSQVETVVQSYNSAVAPYTSSKIQMFKQRLLYKLQELLGPVGLIRNGLMKLITSIVRKMARNDDGLRPTLSFYFVRCVEALAVYDLMYEYIKSGKLIQITSGDVQARISELLQGRPNWRSVANHDDVNSLFREFDFSSGGTDNGGPPPGPPGPPGPPRPQTGQPEPPGPTPGPSGQPPGPPPRPPPPPPPEGPQNPISIPTPNLPQQDEPMPFEFQQPPGGKPGGPPGSFKAKSRVPKQGQRIEIPSRQLPEQRPPP